MKECWFVMVANKENRRYSLPADRIRLVKHTLDRFGIPYDVIETDAGETLDCCRLVNDTVYLGTVQECAWKLK